ncbi:hypothetical protein ADUPG1_005373, partial [Aduncisulcus paluster]
TSLDLSDNNISDISVLVTADIFPSDTLSLLDISDNFICDIDSVVTILQSHFTTDNFAVVYSEQSCPCQGSISFSAHKTCRQRSDGEYQVECWDGYYLDKNTNECIKACPIGSSLGPDGETCLIDGSVHESNSDRCLVCQKKPDLISVMNDGDSFATCGCAYGWYGDSCSSDNCSYDSQCKPNE